MSSIETLLKDFDIVEVRLIRPDVQPVERELPQTGLLTSSEVSRINTVPRSVKDAFETARVEANNEALWLAATARRLLADNDALRREVEVLKKKLQDLERS